MTNTGRRRALKSLAAATIAASGWTPMMAGAAAGPGGPIERGATLKLLRWKRYVQGDEDQWMANTARFTQSTGVPVQVESIVGEELRAKGAMAASVGAGPDVVLGAPDMPHQYGDKCVDLTDVANYLGQKYGGWYDVCHRSCIRDGRWISMGIAVVSFCVVYRQSMVRAAGFDGIPRDLDGFLKLCQALKARGTPVGLPLGNGLGDHSWCQWVLWSHGASLVDENDRVVINSKAAAAALEYAKALYATFVPGTISWLDPSNNKAFLAGEISLTWNPISIYYVAKTSADPALRLMAADIQHAHLPIGPVGKPMELHGLLTGFVFKHTKYPNAAREYLRFMLEREQYEAWQQVSLGYMCQTLRAYESNPIWTSDPKITPFRDGPKLTQYAAYPGHVGPASAAVAADLVIPQMFAEAASGQASIADAMAKAQRRAKRYYR
jgi:multiple sugar transport system substrate-binding protein